MSFYQNKSVRSVTFTSNGKLSDTGSVKKEIITYRHDNNNSNKPFSFGDMKEVSRPTYGGVKEKRTTTTREITK